MSSDNAWKTETWTKGFYQVPQFLFFLQRVLRDFQKQDGKCNSLLSREIRAEKTQKPRLPSQVRGNTGCAWESSWKGRIVGCWKAHGSSSECAPQWDLLCWDPLPATASPQGVDVERIQQSFNALYTKHTGKLGVKTLDKYTYTYTKYTFHPQNHTFPAPGVAEAAGDVGVPGMWTQSSLRCI